MMTPFQRQTSFQRPLTYPAWAQVVYGYLQASSLTTPDTTRQYAIDPTNTRARMGVRSDHPALLGAAGCAPTATTTRETRTSQETHSHAAGRYRRQGGSRAQSEGHRRHDPARQAGGDYGAVGVGEVVAGVRHDLRGGSAALCRVAVRVRPAVPGADGEAGRRLHRGAVAGDLDRPEGGEPQPAV